MSTAKGMVFRPVGLAHPAELSLRQRHLMRTNCWTLVHWMLGGPVEVWHPWLVSKTSLVLRDAVARCPCFVTFAVPNQFRYPVSGHEPGILSRHTLDTAECSVQLIMQLEQVVTNWNAILFQVFCGSIFTDKSHVYFYIVIVIYLTFHKIPTGIESVSVHMHAEHLSQCKIYI